MKRRKAHVEEHENHERWLVSYADFITLLFAFFVVMYAVSEVDARKMKKLKGSVQFAFSFEGTGGVGELALFEGGPASPPVLDRTVVIPPIVPEIRSAKRGEESEEEEEGWSLKAVRLLKAARELEKVEQVAEVDMQERGLVIRLSIDYLFDPGGAEISRDALPIIDRIAGILAGTDEEVRIEGHTDSLPIRNSRFRSNWELSTARATNLLSYFVRVWKLPARRFSVSGYGEHRPIASNDTAAGRARNRRVEIVLLKRAELLREPPTAASL